MPNIFYDLSKLNFEHISFSDVFIRKKDYFLARAKYNKNVVWGMVSPNLKIIDVEELPDNFVEVTFSVPTDDPLFANCISKLEEQCINHIYINSSHIYGKNKSWPIIYVNHNSSLRAQPELVEFRVPLNLNSDGTSFWTVGGNERMEQPTFDMLMKYAGRVAILFKMNGVVINRDGKFNADWKVEQVLFKDSFENDKKCLLRKRKTRREKKRIHVKPKPERVVERVDDASAEATSEERTDKAEAEDVSEDLSVDPDIDVDCVKEIPDRIVECEFRKRLFLKGPC